MENRLSAEDRSRRSEVTFPFFLTLDYRPCSSSQTGKPDLPQTPATSASTITDISSTASPSFCLSSGSVSSLTQQGLRYLGQVRDAVWLVNSSPCTITRFFIFTHVSFRASITKLGDSHTFPRLELYRDGLPTLNSRRGTRLQNSGLQLPVWLAYLISVQHAFHLLQRAKRPGTDRAADVLSLVSFSSNFADYCPYANLRGSCNVFPAAR